MNLVPKVSLTIELEGSTIVRNSEVDKIKYSLTKKDMYGKGVSNPDKIIKSGVRKHRGYTLKPAQLHLTITMESYMYMISDEMPYFMHSKSLWKKMHKKARLECYLQRICDSNNGKSYTYVILDE